MITAERVWHQFASFPITDFADRMHLLGWMQCAREAAGWESEAGEAAEFCINFNLRQINLEGTRL